MRLVHPGGVTLRIRGFGKGDPVGVPEFDDIIIGILIMETVRRESA